MSRSKVVNKFTISKYNYQSATMPTVLSNLQAHNKKDVNTYTCNTYVRHQSSIWSPM